jgi:Rps23 Pro-64 3,4-dihydroxylase Tpa1-like proline 4-hydroxylase
VWYKETLSTAIHSEAGMNDDYFYFDPESLHTRAESLASSYRTASPFPHAVIDDLLPDAIARRLANEFPPPNLEGFQRRDNAHQVFKQSRLQENYFKGVSGFARHMVLLFNDHVFIDFLEKLTGIKGIIPDPHFFGGAFHQILPGGKLDIHADFNRDERRKLDRRINVLLYLNEGWQDDWGGMLELWNTDMTRCEKRVSPLLNRCVVFNTTDHSFHGHPEPLCCPEGRTRNSMAFYYYTHGRDDGSGGEGQFKTLWRDRPDTTEQ